MMIQALTTSCKVPIVDIEAEFTISDVSWFAAEETLFVFYELEALAGLNESSAIEIKFTTDNLTVDWTPLDGFNHVHTHVSINCGPSKLCGSASISVNQEPRNIGLRLRYHKDGELTRLARPIVNVINDTSAHRGRSLLIYGVFDETNQHIQWRSRHQFPTIRNEQARDLGLRRYFEVFESGYGPRPSPVNDNPYGYGEPCPDTIEAFASLSLSTLEPAIFQSTPLPLGGRDAEAVCSRATVTDASGTFTTTAYALKNPETQPAFPSLRSPTASLTQIKFLFRPCQETISGDHLDMQMQRLQFDASTPVICTETQVQADFEERVSEQLRDAIALARTPGEDMVLSLILHHDSASTLSPKIERILETLITAEEDKSTPRLTGAFVFDSFRYEVERETIANRVLWCPAVFSELDLEEIPETQEELEDLVEKFPDASQQSCPIAPTNAEIDLGNLSFTSLPILPTRSIYLDFIEDYSKAQAGEMRSLDFRAPLRPTINENIDLGFGTSASFMNGEFISAQPLDAFSYCADELTDFVLIRSEDIESTFESPVLPLEFLPAWHNNAPEERYEVGLAWAFPFLIQLEYESVLAGSASAFAFSVPFGIATTGQALYGSDMWTSEAFDLSLALTHCTRFCDHPSFDGAGIYQIRESFRNTYQDQCYTPRFPQLTDGGFPDDP